MQFHELLHGEDGVWLLSVSFESGCGQRFVSEYDWTVTGSSTVDRSIGAKAPMHSTVFLERVTSQYSLVPLAGYYEKLTGIPTTND